MQISKRSLILQANFFIHKKGKKIHSKVKLLEWCCNSFKLLSLSLFWFCLFILDSMWGHSITKKYIKIVNHGKNVPKISQQHGTYCQSNIIISYSKYLTLIFSVYPWKSTNIADFIHPVYHFQFRVCHKIVCSCLHGNTEHILEFWVC